MRCCFISPPSSKIHRGTSGNPVSGGEASSSPAALASQEQGRALMKKKYLLLALALILPLTFAGAHPMQRYAQTADEAEARKRIAKDFAEALLLAQEKSASTVDYDRAAKASINGMLRTLDP